MVNSRGEKVVHEESQEQWVLEETLKWRYIELTAIQNDGAAATTEAVVHRKIKSLCISHSFLPTPECILPEAFEGEHGCMQRQLAALLEVPIGDIEYDFTLLRPG